MFQFVPLGVWTVGTFFVPESPRYFLLRGNFEKASLNLVRLRRLPADHALVEGELDGAAHGIAEERSSKEGSGYFDIWREIFATKTNRRRFVLLFVCHVLGQVRPSRLLIPPVAFLLTPAVSSPLQWSGANAITQYSPTILGYLGITGDEASLVATGGYAIVKFGSAVLVGIFLVDFFGRRRSLLLGITLQIVTLIYLALYLGITTGRTPAQIEAEGNALRASQGAIAAIFIHACGWSIGKSFLQPSPPLTIRLIPHLPLLRMVLDALPAHIRGLPYPDPVALRLVHDGAPLGHELRKLAGDSLSPRRWQAIRCFHLLRGHLHHLDRVRLLLHARDRWFVPPPFSLSSTLADGPSLPPPSGRSLEGMDKLFDVPLHRIHEHAYPTDDDLKPEMRASATEGSMDKEDVEDKRTVKHVERV